MRDRHRLTFELGMMRTRSSGYIEQIELALRSCHHLFSAHILPPCASIIFLQIYRPRPVPEKDLEENLVNSLGIISGSTPEPLSHILTIAIVPFLLLFL